MLEGDMKKDFAVTGQLINEHLMSQDNFLYFHGS